MSHAHSHAVEHAFTAQAAAFEGPDFKHKFAHEMSWLFEHLTLDAGQLVLDVAAGTGHASRQLAPSVRAVIAFDVTRAMLEAGKRAAEAEGLSNIVFTQGDAEHLPFADASFDVVICRFALHHFERPEPQLAEMARVLRPGGQLVVADMVAHDDATVVAQQNALERLRDASHTGLLNAAQLGGAIADAGLAVDQIERRTVVRALLPWIEHGTSDPQVRERIEAAVRAELAGGEPTGLTPSESSGELQFEQRFAAVTAHKPD